MRTNKNTNHVNLKFWLWLNVIKNDKVTVENSNRIKEWITFRLLSYFKIDNFKCIYDSIYFIIWTLKQAICLDTCSFKNERKKANN